MRETVERPQLFRITFVVECEFALSVGSCCVWRLYSLCVGLSSKTKQHYHFFPP